MEEWHQHPGGWIGEQVDIIYSYNAELGQRSIVNNAFQGSCFPLKTYNRRVCKGWLRVAALKRAVIFAKSGTHLRSYFYFHLLFFNLSELSNFFQPLSFFFLFNSMVLFRVLIT